MYDFDFILAVQLSCLRCSSTVEPIDQEKSESCFHGTVKPKKCDDSEARNSTNLSCFTLVFRHSKSLKGKTIICTIK